MRSQTAVFWLLCGSSRGGDGVNTTKRWFSLGCTAAAALVWLASPGFAASGDTASAFGPADPPPASWWHIGYYTPSAVGTLSYAEASRGAGEASLDFTSLDNTALLVTSQKAKFPTLLGDLTGEANVSAHLTVSNVSGVFTYYGEPSCNGVPPQGLGPLPNVRFYFQTSNAGGFDETHYWWSNPVSWPLGNTDMTISNSFDGSQWSDYYGHFGNIPPYSAGFNAALSNVTAIGLSFGGGCFFENGVGTTDGSGTFTLNSYTVSP
jgi:hypothetical protein